MNNVIEKDIKLIATYARVSTSKQEEDGTIETQLNSLGEFAQKNNYTIVQKYIDNGWSGDSLVRPDLDQLRMDAKKKIWQAVLIYDPDRLARRYSYQELIMDELREAGVDVIFITTPAPKNSEDKILHGVKGLFAEYERAKISERFRLGKLRKVKEGHVLVSEAPYGYSYIAKKDNIHGYYEVNPEESRVIKMIFSWVADERLTLRGVVRRLQELGIKPRKSERGVWSTSTLTNLLRNKTYIGEAHWGSSYAVVPIKPTSTEKYRRIKKSSRRIKPEEEWYKISVPAIFNKDLFDRARFQIEENFRLCKRNTKNEYLLSGKISCACGRKRCGEGPQHGKHLYYRCTDRVLNFPLPRVCNEKGINARIADKLVWKKVAELMSSPELLSKQINRWMNGKQNKITFSAGDIKEIEKEILKLKGEEDRYSKAYGAGVFTVDKLSEYVTPIRERLNSLELQLEKAKQEEAQSSIRKMPSQEDIKEFALKAMDALNNLSFSAKKAIILNVIEKVVGTQEKLIVCGLIPIKNNVEQFTNDWNCRVAECGEVHAF